MDQHAATQQSPSSSTELQQVSNLYLELFTTPQFITHLQQNTQIIWFGRTLRGVPRLESFLKYIRNCQYEHKRFQPPYQCEPIETQPTHFETRKIMPTCKYREQRLNRVTSTTLKSHADSDVELLSDDEEMDGSERCTTPVGQQLTGPTSTRNLPKPNIPSSDSDSTSTSTCTSTSDEEDSDDTDNDIEEVTNEAKRPSSKRMPPFSYLRHFPSRKKVKSIVESSDDESSDSDEITTSADNYKIKYLEMTGFLRCSLKAAFSAPAYINCDKEVRISLSYRRCADKTFVFPMIIYDLRYRGAAAVAAAAAAAATANARNESNVTIPARRNLMLEYDNDDDNAVRAQSANDNDPPEAVSSTTQFNIATQFNATIRGITPIVEGDNDTRLSTAITSTTSLLEASIDLVNTLDSTDLSVTALRTPIKLSNTPPATPKRKPRMHSASMATVASLKRVQESPNAQVPAPKRNAARCLRL